MLTKLDLRLPALGELGISPDEFVPVESPTGPPEPKAKLFVHFGVNRGAHAVLGGYRTNDPDVDVNDPRFKPIPNAYQVDVPVDLDVKDLESVTQRISVLQSGEPITFARYLLLWRNEWWVADAQLVRAADACPGQQTGFAWRQPSEEETLFFGPEDYRESLERKRGPLLSATSIHERALRFFIDLELATHRALVKYPLQQAVHSLTPHLAQRTHCRAYNRAHPASPSRLYRPKRECLERIACFFERLMMETIGDHPDDVAQAAELFAMGRLRWQVRTDQWVTQPSSGNFLLFGELALTVLEYLARDNPARTRIWLTVARAFIAARAIYTEVFERAPGLNGLGAYKACAYNEGRAARWDGSRRAQLRERYAGRDATWLADEAAEATLRMFPEFQKLPPK